MEYQRITDLNKVRQLYHEHMEVDFPPDERPSAAHFLRITEQGGYQIILFLLEGEEVGYAVFHEKDGYVLMNFLAVYENRRGTGIGTMQLETIRRLYQDKKGIILEADHIDYARDEADALIRRRRVAFYQKCGYVCIPDFVILLFGVHYHIMVLPIGEDMSNDREYIYQVLYRMYDHIPTKYLAGAIQWIKG